MTQDPGYKKPVNMGTIIKRPARAISKVLNLYVKGVTNFSNAYNKPLRTMVEVSPNCQQLPRSFSTSRLPDYDQPPEGALVRSISATEIDGRDTNIKLTKFQLYVIQRHCHQMQSCASRKAASRSCRVGMGKIDEDRVSSFRDDNNVFKSKICIKDKDSSKSCSDDNSVLFLE
ncbi:hypothetical protein L1987_35973 [Smallanthus sonchifolius]|uniref:Uncharacterized protein n=1 Tax=Smallanthus sonchifolius TaxID=185202 RepID=A0ACB9HCW5_9ASTR|nr:hypothetical protein L1987_35973 [Smallanthus sonchifolius]